MSLADSPSYTYRPDGLRASKTVGSDVRSYLYDGQSLVAEKLNDVLKVSYTNGLNEVISRTEHDGESADTIFFLYDANCNVNAIVNEDGELVKRFDYEEFGGAHPNGLEHTWINNANAEDSQLKFAGGVGHLTDETGLVYMRARYYDPGSGRFISEDPARNGTNWYAYCGYNPINAVDPSGRMALAGLELFLAMMEIGSMISEAIQTVGTLVSIELNQQGTGILWRFEVNGVIYQVRWDIFGHGYGTHINCDWIAPGQEGHMLWLTELDELFDIMEGLAGE